jgi:hypothetical protein
MLLECLRAAVIGFQRADLPMSSHVHDAENVGAMVQSLCDEPNPQAVTRESQLWLWNIHSVDSPTSSPILSLKLRKLSACNRMHTDVIGTRRPLL